MIYTNIRSSGEHLWDNNNNKWPEYPELISKHKNMLKNFNNNGNNRHNLSWDRLSEIDRKLKENEKQLRTLAYSIFEQEANSIGKNPDEVMDIVERHVDEILAEIADSSVSTTEEIRSKIKNILLSYFKPELPETEATLVMRGSELEPQDFIPSLDHLKNVDLFYGIELIVNDTTRIVAHLVHPANAEQIETVGDMRAVGYAAFGAEEYKRNKIELNPEKSYPILIEVKRLGPDGNYVSIPHATVTVEIGREVPGEYPLTECWRLMTHKDVLKQMYDMFEGLKYAGLLEKDSEVERFADLPWTKKLQEGSTLANRLNIDMETLEEFSEIGSLSFFKSGKQSKYGESLWEGAWNGNIPHMAEEAGADPELFKYQYVLAVTIAAAAMERYGGKYLGAMLLPSLHKQIELVTGVNINVLKDMVLNPYVRNKPVYENGTSLNLSYFASFYPYFLKELRDRELLGNDRKNLGDLPIEEREDVYQLVKDKSRRLDLLKNISEQTLTEGTTGPVMVMVNQSGYINALQENANNSLAKEKELVFSLLNLVDSGVKSHVFES